MSWLTLSEIAAMAGGTLHGEDRPVTGVSIDSRTLRRGELFVALRGERFDGHDFVATCGARGAAGALVERRVNSPVPQVLVADALAGLTRLAAAWRRRCDATMVALTGSNGKTTTRAMLVSVLGRRRVLATRGNLNNHVGVPLTLLGLRAEHELAIIEIGANHPGEVRRLGELVEPAAALVLNAAPAHLEGFGDVEGVARAKGELLECLAEDGFGVVNADDAYCAYWRGLLKGKRVIAFGLDAEDADVGARPLGGGRAEITIAGESRLLHLSLPGRHNLCNALAAAAVAHGLGVGFDDVVTGLEAARAVPGRLCPLAGVGGARLLDDSYNANPGSLVAALEVLGDAAGAGERWLALGDMAELGDEARRRHAEAGRDAAQRGVSRLFTVGALSRAAADAFGAGAERFDSREALAERLLTLLDRRAADVTILIKGSRSSRMDEVVRALEARNEERRAC